MGRGLCEARRRGARRRQDLRRYALRLEEEIAATPPDVVLAYERNIVAMEMVAGAMRIQTLTQGDLETFALDLEKFVYKKATQLTEADRRYSRWADREDRPQCRRGRFNDLAGDRHLVPLPVRPMIMESIRKELKVRGPFAIKRALGDLDHRR